MFSSWFCGQAILVWAAQLISSGLAACLEAADGWDGGQRSRKALLICLAVGQGAGCVSMFLLPQMSSGASAGWCEGPKSSRRGNPYTGMKATACITFFFQKSQDQLRRKGWGHRFYLLMASVISHCKGMDVGEVFVVIFTNTSRVPEYINSTVSDSYWALDKNLGCWIN